MKKVYVNPTAQTYTVDQTDVITTSDEESIGTGGSNMSEGGWTPIEW